MQCRFGCDMLAVASTAHLCRAPAATIVSRRGSRSSVAVWAGGHARAAAVGGPRNPGEASLRLGEDPGEVGALGDPDLSEAALSAAVGEAGAAPGVTVTPEQASKPHLYQA